MSLHHLPRRFLAGLTCLAAIALAPAPRAAGPQSGDIELGLQCWTFRKLTFLETLDKAANLGVTSLEIYPGQKLGGGLEGAIGPDLSAEHRATIKQWLKVRGLAIVSFGVVNAPDEAGWKKLAAFARDMGINTLVTEPQPSLLPVIARIVKGTGIRVALHNHPTPSRYADPATALAAVESLPSTFGLCADTGHWTRDGRDPAACLSMAKGRLVEVHFKDISEPARAGHDMPWGTGIGGAAGQIAELRRQGFKGRVVIEYEHDTAELEANVGRCIAYFRAAARASIDELVAGQVTPPGFTKDVAALWRYRAASSAAKWPSPQPLFAADLSDAEFPEGAWAWEDGVLVAKGGGDIWTKESYGDFVLSLEFKVEAKGNSGVFLRSSDTINWLHNSIEVQILQGDTKNPRQVVGSIFDVLAPDRQKPIEPGTWHHFVIIAQGPKIIVHLDGDKILEADLDQWTTPHLNPDGTPNKFNNAYRDMAREGRVGLQYHKCPVWFRNLLVEKL